MAPLSREALKAVKSAIDSNDFTSAAEKASELVRQDSKNYAAYLFLGFACEKLDQDEQAEKAYEVAASIRPKDPQALKGLISLDEKRSSARLDHYHHIVHRLAELYAEFDDKLQGQTVVDRYELFARKHGSRAQYRHALELLLPSSSLYGFLEGRIPQPSHTYQRILESSEAEEKEWINQQIGERRTRLGARLDQVTLQVKQEAVRKFQIEDLYRCIIDWTNDDELRRGYEEKLLQRAFENLSSLPVEAKPAQRDVVLNLANGMVIIKHPFELAWIIALEWVNADSLAEWDVNIFREFLEFFPDHGLSKVLRGYLDGAISPFPKHPDGSKESDRNETLSEADRLLLMVEGLDETPASLLSHRIMAEIYLYLEEFGSTVDIARKAQRLHSEAMLQFNLELQDSLDSVAIVLANALTFYQSPRHHPEVKAMFQSILTRKPTTTAALLGVGLIFEEEEDFEEAVDFLEQASKRDPTNLRVQLERAWCHARADELCSGLSDLETSLAAIEAQKPVNTSMKAEALYRIGYCRWHLDPSKAARKDKGGAYKDLMSSIKANPSYAPPYTLLGVYFEDYGKSKQRARTAFQKAFELSTSEIEAAERLARTFADSGEWDLVELIAQRVVDSGKARPAPGSKKKAFGWPYAALGVVEMNRRQFSNSIVHFQAALRISPTDYHCWVGLGESYHNSGRYIAATRAFMKAESLKHGLPVERTWFAKYMLANVQREMGSYDEAIDGYTSVLKIKEAESGVSIALLQTLAESARAKIEMGMFGEATTVAVQCIDVAAEITKSWPGSFNLWKAVADACSVLACTKAYSSQVPFTTLSALLDKEDSPEELLNDLSRIDMVEHSSTGRHVNGEKAVAVPSDICLVAAIVASKLAIRSAARDVHALAVSWFNLGWTEYQASSLASPQLQTKGTHPHRFLKAAVRCFKRAIELEAGNAEFWNALGVVTMTLNPKVSQHSLVRSIHLNDRSARVWTNLGALYLVNNDDELANEAFTRAQSADPDYAHAWLGQGLLALRFGNEEEARALFAHAFDIAPSDSLPAKRQYALSAFDHVTKNVRAAHNTTGMIQPLFALHQLHAQSPAEMPSNHLSSLFAERLGKFEEAVTTLSVLCEDTEAEFEQSESTKSLSRFAQGKGDLARAHLARREFEAAIECAETALGLSLEEGLTSEHAEGRRKWRLSAHLTAGLAYHCLNVADKSIEMIQAALQETAGEPDIVCMLAQVLWTKGGDHERDAARQRLYDCVEAHPDHVGAVTLLSVIALLDDDADALEAVKEDLEALRISDRVDIQTKMRVTRVLAGVVACTAAPSNDGDDHVSIAEATKGVMLAPSQPQGWSDLAGVTQERFPAEMALTNATRASLVGALDAPMLSKALADTGKRKDALQAILVAPWIQDGYQSLADSL